MAYAYQVSSIFLSHSSRDDEAAAEVKAWLEGEGHRSIFLDFDPAQGIPAGRNWERELYQQLRACRAVIVLCSEHSMASRWCFAEITHARSLGKHIFPIQVGDCAVDSLLSDLQILDYLTDREAALARLGRGLRAAGVDAADPMDWDGSRPPYPGLLAFDEKDAAIFFGRDDEIGTGLDRLNQMQRYGGAGLMLVLGGSGSGKSSMVRAGMLPRLRRAEEQWLIVDPFRPEEEPQAGLAVALAQAFEAMGEERDWKELLSLLEVGAGRDDAGAALVELVRELRMGSERSEATVLLVIDQFEELLGHAPDHPAGRFLTQLRSALEPGREKLIVVATLRSDFLGTFQAHPAIGNMPFRQLPLPPIPKENLREIIEKPAELAGIDLEPSLVQALLEDTQAEDALPLLAFTLRELWELLRQDRSFLAVSDYRDRLGGLQGSVARAADGVLASRPISTEEEDALRGAFLGMVRLDDEGHFARRAVGWAKLSEKAHEWLESFVQARLLVSHGDRESRTLEVAHEALFRAWGKLAAWLDENREALLLRRELDQAARLWERGGRSPEDLWRGGRLHRALEVRDQTFDRRREARGDGSDAGRLPTTVEQLDFLDASEQAELDEQARRRRRRLTILAASLGVAAFCLLLAMWAIFERRQTEMQASRVLAMQAYTLRDSLDLALLLAVEAASTAESFESRTSLLSLLALQPRLETILDQQGAKVNAVAISPDGRYLAAGGDAGDLRLFDLRTGEERALANQDRVISLAFSPDGGTLLSAGAVDGGLHLWDPVAGSLRKTLSAAECSPLGAADSMSTYSVAFHPERRSIASAHSGGRVRLWDEASGQCRHEADGHQGKIVLSLAFEPGGRRLASGGEDGYVQLWDTATGLQPTRRFQAHDQRLTELAFSPDGSRFATGGSEGKVRLWDLDGEPSPIREIVGVAQGRVDALVFDRAGDLLASAGGDGGIRVWDPESGELRFRMPGHAALISSLAWGPGDLMASGSQDRQVLLWHARGGGPAGVEISGHEASLKWLENDPRGKTVASASADATVRLWDLESGALDQGPLQHGNGVRALAYSPDGGRLAAGDRDGKVKLWNTATGEELPLTAQPEEIACSWVWYLAFDPTGERLVAGCNEVHMLLWDLAAGSPPVHLRLPEHVAEAKDRRFRALAFADDGRLAGSAGPTVLLWDFEACAGDLAACEPLAVESGDPKGEFLSLSFAPGGRSLYGGTARGGIRRWNEGDDPRTMRFELLGHEQQARTLAFDGEDRLASGGGDGVVRYWDLETREPLFELRGHQRPVHAVSFAEGRLISSSEDETVRSWEYADFDDLDALRRRACRIANRDLTEIEWSLFLGANKTYRSTCERKWTGLAP